MFKPEVLFPGYASASVLMVRGRASIAWELREGRLRVEVHVPVGSHGTVHLTSGNLAIDGKEADGELPPGVEEVRRDTGLSIRVSSGDYRMEIKLAARS